MRNKDEFDLEKFLEEIREQVHSENFKANRTFIPNLEGFKKFYEVCAYFKKFSEKNKGVPIAFDTEPDSTTAGLTVDIPSAYLIGNDLQEFKDIIQKVDLFSIMPIGNDMVSIEASVFDVWKAVKANE